MGTVETVLGDFRVADSTPYPERPGSYAVQYGVYVAFVIFFNTPGKRD